MLRKTYHLLELTATAISGLILFVLLLLGVVDVLLPLAGFSVPFIVEISQYGLAASIFLALPKVQSSASNISIDIFLDRFSAKTKMQFNRGYYLIVSLALFGLGFLMTEAALESLQSGEYSAGAAQIVIWPFKALSAAGVLLAGVGAFVFIADSNQEIIAQS